MALIVPEGAELGFACPYDDCGHLMKFTPSDWSEGERYRKVDCGNCGRRIHLRKDATATKPMTTLQMVLLVLVVVILGPPILLDMYIHPRVAAISPWIQEHLNVSKWWLALMTLVAGIVMLGCDQDVPVFHAVIWSWVWWSTLKWLYYKATTNSDDSGEVLRLEDQEALNKSTGSRIVITAILMFWVLLVIPLVALTGELGAAISDSWFIGMFICWVAFHWIQAEYVPPWKRKVIDFLKDPAHAFQGR